MKIKEINGNEIIDFLNTQSRDNDDLCDISISSNSFVFQSQEVGTNYELTFKASYNNWGTDQEIPDNIIRINKNGKVIVAVCEPFEGDGTDDALEKVLTEWLKTHVFNTDYEEKFNTLIKQSYEQLRYIKFDSKEDLQEVIDKLIEAKTYMK